MSSSFFLLEVEIDVHFATNWWRIDFKTCRPDAPIEGIIHKSSLGEDGKWHRWAVLLVRDRGAVINANCDRAVLVVRSLGGITELPNSAGALIGSFHAQDHLWHVFHALSAEQVARRLGRPSPRSGGQSPRSETRAPVAPSTTGSSRTPGADRSAAAPSSARNQTDESEPDLFGGLS